jgi:hypothetical protein
MEKTRICTGCKRELPETEQYFHRCGSDKFQSKCKECRGVICKTYRDKSGYGKKYYAENKDDMLAQMREAYREKHPIPPSKIIPEGFKGCCKCHEVKPATEEYFNRLKKSKDGLRYECRECRVKEYLDDKDRIVEKSRKRYVLKKDIILIKNKEYKEKRKEWYERYFKNYYTENKETIKANSKRNIYKRLEKDMGFKLLVRYRTRLYKALKGISKSKCTRELIGCSIKKLKEHIENQFKNGMSWDNYGEWHVDHIKPCVMFDFTKEEEQKKCFNYTNLQPLWAEDNRRKHGKVTA